MMPSFYRASKEPTANLCHTPRCALLAAGMPRSINSSSPSTISATDRVLEKGALKTGIPRLVAAFRSTFGADEAAHRHQFFCGGEHSLRSGAYAIGCRRSAHRGWMPSAIRCLTHPCGIRCWYNRRHVNYRPCSDEPFHQQEFNPVFLNDTFAIYPTLCSDFRSGCDDTAPINITKITRAAIQTIACPAGQGAALMAVYGRKCHRESFRQKLWESGFTM